MTETDNLKDIIEIKEIRIGEQNKRIENLEYEKRNLLEQIEHYKNKISRLERELRKGV
ncbi:MAG: hypothetical protein GTN40_02605 [Candidatus Aenigmarchaeota archaeon]|nr:hypothetical protein [Candidatus Aenigmarchaeota archaeon]